MRTSHLNELLVVAILLISTVPLSAQRQQQNVAKLKADAQTAQPLYSSVALNARFARSKVGAGTGLVT